MTDIDKEQNQDIEKNKETDRNNQAEKEAGSGRLSFKPAYFIYLAIIAGIFLLCFHLRQKYLLPFYSISTMDYMGIKLFQGVLDEKALLFVLLKHFSMQLLPGYFLSSILVFGAMVLSWLILRDIPGFEESCGNFVNRIRTGGRVYLVAGAVLLLLLMLFIQFQYLAGMPVSTDEFSYLFQANIFKSLHLYAPAPESPEFYQFENIVINDGKWYSKYTAGFPALLSIGVAVGLPWIINPLLAILVAFFIFRISELLFDRTTAYFSIFIAFLSPFFLFNGAASFQPHISVACALLGSACFYFMTIKREDFRWHYAILCGVFFTLGASIRPIDSALWGISFFLLSLFLLFARQDRKILFIRFLAVLATALAGVFLILCMNKIYTGQFTKFAFHQFQQTEVWGIGSMGHNIYRAIWNSFYTMGRLLSWGAVFFTEFALLSFLSKERKKSIFLWFVFLVFAFFYFGWYGIGAFEYGPRFYTSGLVFLIPASACGLKEIFDRLAVGTGRPNAVKCAFVSISLLYGILIVYPIFFPVLTANIQQNSGVQLIRISHRIQKESGGKIAVFVTDALDHRVDTRTRNIYPPNRQDVVFLIFLEPEKDMEFITKNYPGYKPYLAFYDPGKSRYDLQPFPNLPEMTPAQKAPYYLFSGFNYKFSLQNPEMAKKNWLEAYRLDPNNLAPLINLASALQEEGKTEESKGYWEEILKRNPDLPASYQSLGLICEKMKEDKKALDYYNEFIRRAPGSPDTVYIREKLFYYNKYGRFPEN